MFHLINPFGKIVVLNLPEHYDKWKDKPGFEIPTKQQIDEYQTERKRQFEEVRQRSTKSLDKGIYMLSVSPGGADGYSNSSRILTRELNSLGVRLNTTFQNQEIGLVFHNPYSIISMQTRFRILYTMFESDKLPDDWSYYLESADKIIVPSKWCQSVFKKAGFDADVIPLGYDDTLYTYVERKKKDEAHEPFTFLHYDAFNIRKGFPEVFRAFTQEFNHDEPVKLVFKFRKNKMPIPILKSQYPNIDVILGQSTEQEMAQMIAESDCFVFPSRGEGFGMTPLETMATGMPAIVPNAHGISEYFNDEYMYEVKVKETCPGLYHRYKGQNVGNMVVCDTAHLQSQMRYVYEHQAEARAKGKAASEWVKQWTFKKTAAKFKTLFDELAEQEFPDRALKNVITLEKIT